MSEWTKRDQARVDFLNKTVAFFRALDAHVTGPEFDLRDVEMAAAWKVYRDLIDGKAENATLDPDRWFCPHCGAARPEWNFHLVGVVVMGIGAIQYFNVYCSNDSCRKLITVMLAGFAPEAALLAQAQEQIKNKKIHTA